jgi:predicted benzoate:H+ symporter BenE
MALSEQSTMRIYKSGNFEVTIQKPTGGAAIVVLRETDSDFQRRFTAAEFATFNVLIGAVQTEITTRWS